MDEGDASKARRHLRPNRGKNPNARWIVDEVVKKKPVAKKRKTAPKHEEQPILEGETLCACKGSVGDDKTMAECEKCKTWQHVVCEFGVDDESALPEKYQCWRCRDDDVKDENASSNGSSDTSVEAPAENQGGLDKIKDKVRRSVAEAWLKILEPLVAKHETEIGSDAKSYALQLSLDIESALYTKYGDHEAKDPGHVYREQFRMLSFNLKDEKNSKLQSDVVTKSIEPAKFVTLSSSELRPPEMRKLANEIKKESLHESIISEPEPPKEKVSTSTAEVNMEPTFIALDEEGDKDGEEEDKAMREPLGPPPTVSEEQTKSSEQPPNSPDHPVWQGRLRLGSRMDFTASGVHLQAPSRDEWSHFLENHSSLAICGAVPSERAIKYLSETVANEHAHSIATLVLSSHEPGKIDELYEYLTSRDRIGAVEHSSSRVKDAYLLPVASDSTPEFLGLDSEAKAYLGHLRAEHNAKTMLLLTLVLFK